MCYYNTFGTSKKPTKCLLLSAICFGVLAAGVLLISTGYISVANATGTARSGAVVDTVDTRSSQDTITVEGPLVVVGSEPFTKLRLMQKNGGYMLAFEAEDTIELRRNEPTRVRITGVPYEDLWQGGETTYLRVLEWEYVDRPW